MDQATKEAGKTMAIISYITIIGLAIAYFTNQGEKKNEFVMFHIGQSVRIAIIVISNIILSRFLPSIIGSIIGLLCLVLMILGAVNANNLKEEPLPVIGTIGG